MNLVIRFLWVWFAARFAPTVEMFEVSRLKLRVWITDIDLIGHMNNGRYLSIMDLGRVDYMVRNHIFKQLTNHAIYPVVASAMIRYKKSLGLFKRYELATQLLGWDERFFYLKQSFWVKDELYALSVVKIRFIMKKRGSIDPAVVLPLIGLKEFASPALPDWIMSWNEGDKAYYQSTNRNENK